MRLPWLLTALIVGPHVAWSGSAAAQSAPVATTYRLPGPPPGARIRYEPGVMPPPGYHLEENPRKGLVVSGALTFAIPYFISVMIAGASRNEADRWLFIPVGGPAGALAAGRGTCDDTNSLSCAGHVLAATGLAFDLAAQSAGAILFSMAYIFPKKEWVSDYEVGRRTPPAVAWSIAPRIEGTRSVGLTVSGVIF